MTVPVSMSDDGLAERDGVEAKTVIVEQLARALEVIREYYPARSVTVGGRVLRQGGVVLRAHPPVRTGPGGHLDRRPSRHRHPAQPLPGYHAIAVAALTGHGDPDVLELLPATDSPDRIAVAGLHAWTKDDFPNAAEWDIQPFSPGGLRLSTRPLLE
jgi:arginase